MNQDLLLIPKQSTFPDFDLLIYQKDNKTLTGFRIKIDLYTHKPV